MKVFFKCICLCYCHRLSGRTIGLRTDEPWGPTAHFFQADSWALADCPAMSIDIAGSDPYTWQNFVIGTPTARQGQLDWFLLKKKAFNIHTGRKMDKNPLKKKCSFDENP